ncbi:hypothetical protein MtrunA17_Chr8g0387871 [Medicago truncatula]|uniref:Uncharacterized protein n=1 Tax=Medicago truncatula TaxID=3880 RepID=A0A396GTD9_MEDTR|nr:hypothetical protein MtrunA17_Chr8g0387871 [Medicago truncatula]
MLFVCLSSTTNLDSELGNKFNLSNQARDRSLLGYDIGIDIITFWF